MRYTVLTLWQPWAFLLVRGFKTIETRSWATSYRGSPLLVHAAKGFGPGGKRGLQRLCDRPEFANVLWYGGVRKGEPPNDSWADVLPRGAIIGSVNLIDCVPSGNVGQSGAPTATWRRGEHWWLLTDQEREFGNFSEDRHLWLCAEPRAFTTPIPARGARRLWTWEGELPV